VQRRRLIDQVDASDVLAILNLVGRAFEQASDHGKQHSASPGECPRRERYEFAESS
jgi:hypothetical protein